MKWEWITGWRGWPALVLATWSTAAFALPGSYYTKWPSLSAGSPLFAVLLDAAQLIGLIFVVIAIKDMMQMHTPHARVGWTGVVVRLLAGVMIYHANWSWALIHNSIF